MEDEEVEATTEPVILTAAEILRRRQQSRFHHRNDLEPLALHQQPEVLDKEDSKSLDLDEEIKRLEAELQDDVDDADEASGSNSSSSSSSSKRDEDSHSCSSSTSTNTATSSSSSSTRSSSHSPGTEAQKSEMGGGGGGVLCLSTLKEEDRIEALPEKYLPLPQKASKSKKRERVVNHDDKHYNNNNDNNEDLNQPTAKRQKPELRGLESAVRQVLEGYVARSSERLPFYCRFCSKQYSNQEEFFRHRQSDEFHKKAVEMERKLSYCKLCRKQLTSPAQLKEHLTSRPHKERLQRVQQNQNQRNNNDHQTRGERQTHKR